MQVLFQCEATGAGQVVTGPGDGGRTRALGWQRTIREATGHPWSIVRILSSRTLREAVPVEVPRRTIMEIMATIVRPAGWPYRGGGEA